MKDVIEALRKRGFAAEACANKTEALAKLRELIKDAQTIGFGGSVTLKELGAAEALAADGKQILRHGDPSLTPEQKKEVMRQQQICDAFLLSANALTRDGRIVNIDGNGNRVAASIYGPQQVIFVVGRNKIVDGGIDAALERIHHESCGKNCRRLNKKTPCAIDDVCRDCDSPDRICKVTVIMDRKPTTTPMTILLVNEPLGY